MYLWRSEDIPIAIWSIVASPRGAVRCAGQEELKYEVFIFHQFGCWSKLLLITPQCDETKPTCNQCAKSRRVCPGYKDDFDLVFRNETQATERRARRAVNSKRAGSQISLATQQSSFSATSTDETSPERSPTLIAPNPDQDMSKAISPLGALSIPLEQQAPCFFVSNFVIAPRLETRGYFDFLLPMLKSESANSHLSLAFSAVAMASLANRPNTRGQRMLFSQAIGQYTKALKATNLAVQTPAHQKTDATLAAILMLGFFEV